MFIKKSNIIHNYKYNYSEVEYINNKTKVKIICPKHGIFNQKPNDHLMGHGCPICKESYGEKQIGIFLDNNNIRYIRQKKFKNCKNIKVLPFDFYLPEYNMCIEFDGIQHFKKIDKWGGENNYKLIMLKDNIKNNYCKNNNIYLLRIKYNDDIITILEKYLNKGHKIDIISPK